MAKKPPKPKLVRDLPDLIRALERQLRVLERACDEAFVNRNPDYLPEIATKLRILVFEGDRGTPLLLSLLDLFNDPGLVPRIDYLAYGNPFCEGHPAEPLKAAIHRWSFSRRVGSDVVTFGPREAVAVYADQAGGAHEDQAFSLVSAVVAHSPGLGTFDGMPLELVMLRKTASLVLFAGKRFLAGLTPDAVWMRRMERMHAEIEKRSQHQRAIDALMDKADAAEMSGQYSTAAILFGKAVEDASRGAEARYRRAVCQCLCGESLEEAENVLAMREPQVPIRPWLDPMMRAFVLCHRGQVTEAATVLGGVMQSVPSDCLGVLVRTPVFYSLVVSPFLTEDLQKTLGDCWREHFICPVEKWLCPLPRQ